MNLIQKPDWFLARNPMGKVPTIQLENESQILYESIPVCDFLDKAYPGPKLTPESPFQQAKDSMLIEHFSQSIGPFYKLAKRTDLTPEEKKETAALMLSKLDYVENELGRRESPFFGGKTVMMVDYMIWPWIERMPIMTKFAEGTELTKYRFPLLVRNLISR